MLAVCLSLVGFVCATPVDSSLSVPSSEAKFPLAMQSNSKKVDVMAENFKLKNENAKLKLALEETNTNVQSSDPKINQENKINKETSLKTASEDRDQAVQDAIAAEEAAVHQQNEQSKNEQPPKDVVSAITNAMTTGDDKAYAEAANLMSASTPGRTEAPTSPETPPSTEKQATDEVGAVPPKVEGEAPATPPAAEENKADGMSDKIDMMEPNADAIKHDGEAKEEEKKASTVTGKENSNPAHAASKAAETILETVKEKFAHLAKIVGVDTNAMKRRAVNSKRSTKSLVLAALTDEGATPEAFLANCTREGYDDACCESVLRATFATFSIAFSYAFAQGACPAVDVDCNALKNTLVGMQTCPASMVLEGEEVSASKFAETWDQVEKDARTAVPDECHMLSDTCEVSSWTEHAEAISAASGGGRVVVAVVTALLSTLMMQV